MNLTIGIDASNIRQGGGVTHLAELLSNDPRETGFGRVVIWGSHNTLKKIKNSPWLDKYNPPELNKGFIHRTLWQCFKLSTEAKVAGCDVLFVPGGSYAGSFHPVVTMSQNLLPFDQKEIIRYGLSVRLLKLLLLRLTQSESYKRVDGLIFLTEYARHKVSGVTGKLSCKTSIIPHGLNSRFKCAPKPQNEIVEYSDKKPYRILYVSIIDNYKHQWHVVEAVELLRKLGFPLELELVGPAYGPALFRLNATIDRLDMNRKWVHYHGAIDFDALHDVYARADLGLFASSCENMPNILLETMASGLPIACSNRGPMPEVLGDAGVYFDPEQPEDIAKALKTLIESPSLRANLASLSYISAQKYSWDKCMTQTFDFLAQVAQDFKKKQL